MTPVTCDNCGKVIRYRADQCFCDLCGALLCYRCIYVTWGEDGEKILCQSCQCVEAGGSEP